MRPSVRAAGVASCAVLSAITLAASGLVPAAQPASVGGDASSIPRADQTTITMPAATGQQTVAAAERAVLELRGDHSQPVIGRDRTGRLLSVTAQPGTTLPVPGGASGPDAFVRHYGPAFGLTSDYGLQRVASRALPGGDSVVRYQQQAAGVPLLGGQLVVTVDPKGGVRSTIGETSSTKPTATAAKVDARTAAATALAEAARKAGVAAETLAVSENKLWLYDPRMVGAPGGAGVRPTWWVKVSDQDGGEIASVLVDALDGSVSLAISERREARDRIVCDLVNRSVNLNDRNQYACNAYSPLGQQSTTRREGGAASTVTEVNKAYDYLGAAYNFFWNRFGRDSYDGRGAQIQATVRACDVRYYCPFSNAFWEGSQLVFGQGFVTDDVVTHEFTHAVTQYSSDLFYAYEPGALNEAISDIMGEFVDQSYNASGEDISKLWLAGEDLPYGAIRDMANPNNYQQPATVGGTYWSSRQPDDPYFDNGGVHTNSGPANRLAYLIAQGASVDGVTIRGIGLPKSEQLWYRTAHQLPSGADYNTLGVAIYSTCLQMVGFHNIVRDDCAQVGLAVGRIGTWTTNVDTPCGGGSSEDPPVFADDMERRDKWSFSGSIWQYIPNTDIPVRWATSGETALYGYGNGTTGYATMNSNVTVPVNNTYGGPYLTFQATDPSSGGWSVYSPAVEYNDGSGWKVLWPSSLREGMFGYKMYAVSLNALQGKSVKLRIGLNSNNYDHEWLVDDVKVFSCRYMDTPARFVTATRTDTSAEVTFVYDSWPNDHIELSYAPPIPGAPTRLDGLGVNQSEVTRSFTVTGLDPDTTYTVSIVIVDDQNNTRSRPATVTLAKGLPAICPTRPPLSFTFTWSARRPGGVVDECGNPIPAPRR